MLALVGLFSAGLASTTMCQEPGVAADRVDAESQCDGMLECVDGCDMCGFTMCELPMENFLASPYCICDYMMCWTYCAKKKCPDDVFADHSDECSWLIREGGDFFSGCQLDCSAAWTLSPLSALVLMFVRW